MTHRNRKHERKSTDLSQSEKFDIVCRGVTICSVVAHMSCCYHGVVHKWRHIFVIICRGVILCSDVIICRVVIIFRGVIICRVVIICCVIICHAVIKCHVVIKCQLRIRLRTNSGGKKFDDAHNCNAEVLQVFCVWSGQLNMLNKCYAHNWKTLLNPYIFYANQRGKTGCNRARSCTHLSLLHTRGK